VSSVRGTETLVDGGDDAGFLPKSARVTTDPRRGAAVAPLVLTLTLPEVDEYPLRKDAARESGVARGW